MKYLLIDGNSIGYACHYATKLHSGGMETQAIFGFVKTMRELRVTYPDATPIVLWDGRAEWRFKLCPTYKSNRDNDPKKVAIKEAYAKQTPFIKDLIEPLGIRQMRVLTHEADDMAGYMVTELTKKPDTEIVLISGDQDWLQLVRPGVSWRDMRDDAKNINYGNFFDKTAYKTPLGFLEGKCLQGDSSDVISGVGGIGEKGAVDLIATFGSVRNFWQQCADGSYKPTKKALISLYEGEGRALYRRNVQMMQLLKVTKPAPEAVEVRKGAFDKDKFHDLCAELAFSSITKNIDHFTQPFQG
jgi:5'-3' exonuclease